MGEGDTLNLDACRSAVPGATVVLPEIQSPRGRTARMRAYDFQLAGSLPL